MSRRLTRPDSCWALPAAWEPWLETAVKLYLAGGGRADAKDLPDRVEAAQPSDRAEASTVAVVPVIGPVSYRSDWFSEFFGGAIVSSIGAQLRRAAGDPAVKAIVMPIDSPGGSVYGLQELSEQMRIVREMKPIITVADPFAASAAYYIGSQGTEFVVTPSGEIGSIGVFIMAVDLSEALSKEGIKVKFIKRGKYKTEGNPFEPMTDEAEAALQKVVDRYYDQFVADVAKGRGVAAKDVRNGFGEGRLVGAKEAVGQGMADRVGTMQDTMERVVGGKWKPTKRSADTDSPTIVASDATAFDEAAAAIAAAASDMQPKDPPAEPPVPKSEPEPDADGFDEIARLRVQEWAQADAERVIG